MKHRRHAPARRGDFAGTVRLAPRWWMHVLLFRLHFLMIFRRRVGMGAGFAAIMMIANGVAFSGRLAVPMVDVESQFGWQVSMASVGGRFWHTAAADRHRGR